MERIMKELDRFAETLRGKGYDGVFQTDCGFAGKLKDSISQYLHDSLLGKENGLANGFSLTTYLEWNGEDKPYITTYMKARYYNGKFEVRGMVLEYKGRFGALLRKKQLENLTEQTLPNREDAVALVKESITQKNTIQKIQKRHKFW